jgi:hypothetical protein
MRSVRVTTRGALTIAAALALMACGHGGDADRSPATTTPTSATSVVDPAMRAKERQLFESLSAPSRDYFCGARRKFSTDGLRLLLSQGQGAFDSAAELDAFIAVLDDVC